MWIPLYGGCNWNCIYCFIYNISCYYICVIANKRKLFAANNLVGDNRMHKIVVCLVFHYLWEFIVKQPSIIKVLFIFDAFRSNLEPLFLPFRSNFSFFSLNIYLREYTMGYVTINNRLRDPSFLFFLTPMVARFVFFPTQFLRSTFFALRAQMLHIKNKICTRKSVWLYDIFQPI